MRLRILLALFTVSGMFIYQSVGEEAAIEKVEESPREVIIVEEIETPTIDVQEEEIVSEIVEQIPEYEPPIEDVYAIARTLYGECRGIPSDAEKAAVAWVILNRVDAGYGDSVIDVVTAPNQFLGYNASYPVWEELEYLASDVLTRWYKEKSGESDVGRVIPADYLWFRGDGKHNYFRNEFRSNQYWDWSLENPYED